MDTFSRLQYQSYEIVTNDDLDEYARQVCAAICSHDVGRQAGLGLLADAAVRGDRLRNGVFSLLRSKYRIGTTQTIAQDCADFVSEWVLGRIIGVADPMARLFYEPELGVTGSFSGFLWKFVRYGVGNFLAKPSWEQLAPRLRTSDGDTIDFDFGATMSSEASIDVSVDPRFDSFFDTALDLVDEIAKKRRPTAVRAVVAAVSLVDGLGVRPLAGPVWPRDRRRVWQVLEGKPELLVSSLLGVDEGVGVDLLSLWDGWTAGEKSAFSDLSTDTQMMVAGLFLDDVPRLSVEQQRSLQSRVVAVAAGVAPWVQLVSEAMPVLVWLTMTDRCPNSPMSPVRVSFPAATVRSVLKRIVSFPGAPLGGSESEVLATVRLMSARVWCV